ncbi:MAG: hypothetical protein BWY09_00836 [Candidatus Hydrogenedentes bacterium ADurb.Bin179]|nr:MAG: hypothetical protein BWY09_00836 [Candidatus Hydrogenedentes bacterium ADurb.Bin179]
MSVACLLAVLAALAAPFQLAVFREDITIPLGHACMGGGISPATEVVDPLYAHGVVLLGPDKPLVFVAVDWCEIRNDAYDHWRTALAEAAGTTRERVLLASVHQHDAPVVDYEAQRLLDEAGLEKSLCDVAFAKQCVGRAAAALKEALKSPRNITHYGIGMAQVEGITSNRRVVLPDGTVTYGRGSATKDPALQALPEGIIDPFLKTLSFWDGDTPLAALSAYSTHPMSYYGKGGVSADFVGMARARRQAEMPDVFQMYFTGCSGDTTAGKFNDGDPANRPALADRIYQGMVNAWENMQRYPLERETLRVAPLNLVPKSFGGYSEADARATLADTSAKTFTRNLAAMALSYRKRVVAGQPIDVPVVDFGKAKFLILPGESFVQYQITAQGMSPDAPMVTAGFGECAPGYIPTAIASTEGYNEESWCWVEPGAEPLITDALALAVRGK